MKKLKKKVLLVVVIMTTAVLCMAGCAKKETGALTRKNSSEVDGSFYKYRIHDKYRNINNGLGTTYEGEDGIAIVVSEDGKVLCTPEGYKENWELNLSSSFSVNSQSMMSYVEQLENGYSHINIYADDLTYYYQVDCIVFSGRAITFVSVAPIGVSDVLVKDVADILDTVEYTSTVTYPNEENYPYTVSSSDFKITINKGLYCAIEGEFEKGNSDYRAQIDARSGEIEVRPYGVKSYEAASISQLSIIKTNSTSLDEYANNKFEKQKEKTAFQDQKMEEKKLGDIWPAIESDMKDITVYDISFMRVMKDVQSTGVGDKDMLFHQYCYEYKGNVYCVTVAYLSDCSEDVKDSLYDVMYNIEYL